MEATVRMTDSAAKVANAAQKDRDVNGMRSHAITGR
jgi:hypothetical protein